MECKAIVVSQNGGPEVLKMQQWPVPNPGPGEALVRHRAIGLNFVEIYFRAGVYPAPSMPFVPGTEAAGVVEAVGSNVTEVKVGDRVAYASGPLGAYSEVRVVPARFLVKLPNSISDETAAAVLLKGLTAHYLLKSVYPVRSGDNLLVHAGAGGVGLILTQWAAHLGARVITTVSNEEKERLSRRAGAAEVLRYPTDAVQFGQQIRELTGGTGATAVYDGVGATTFDASLASLAVRGTLALFGAASGPVPPFDPLLRRLKLADQVAQGR